MRDPATFDEFCGTARRRTFRRYCGLKIYCSQQLVETLSSPLVCFIAGRTEAPYRSGRRNVRIHHAGGVEGCSRVPGLKFVHTSLLSTRTKLCALLAVISYLGFVIEYHVVSDIPEDLVLTKLCDSKAEQGRAVNRKDWHDVKMTTSFRLGSSTTIMDELPTF